MRPRVLSLIHEIHATFPRYVYLRFFVALGNVTIVDLCVLSPAGSSHIIGKTVSSHHLEHTNE